MWSPGFIQLEAELAALPTDEITVMTRFRATRDNVPYQAVVTLVHSAGYGVQIQVSPENGYLRLNILINNVGCGLWLIGSGASRFAATALIVVMQSHARQVFEIAMSASIGVPLGTFVHVAVSYRSSDGAWRASMPVCTEVVC